ncbi:hypothetical protein C2E23DRAFT_723679 [Lenzites betulinus]|nr:hypothetical protein C2E23DRAFT_723679 [Lenzites betulinus]
MSTVHLSLDDYVFPGNKPHPAYELSYALGAPQHPSLYSHPSLEAQPSGSHHQARFNHHPADNTHPTYLPDHPKAFLTQYYAGMGGMGCTQFDGSAPPYAMAQRPSSPRTVYAANPAWGVPEGYGAPSDPTASSSSFLHNFQNAINASHTTHAQQQAADQAELAPPQPRAVSPTPWTLSGSLDPATGVFQRSVEHPRLRTAQACEKCRIRKAKCSGDHPTCQRCLSRGLQCEYAPERKMRGPNKQKRKSVSSQKHTDGSPDGDRRSSITSITSITSTVSSSSDASGFDGHAAAATAAVNGSRPSSRASRASPHSGMQSSPLRTNAPRPRSSTIALGAIKRAAEYTPSSRLHMDQAASPHIRQRPPPIDLSSARQFPNGYPNMLAHYTRGGEPIGAYGPPAAPGFGGASEARRPSLPPYLLEAYSRIAFANPEAPPHHAAYHDPSPFAVGPPPPSAESSGMARYVLPYSPYY